jgi:hypothetical protein
MKNFTLLVVALGFCGFVFGAGPGPKPDDAGNLESVLRKMDAVSASFRSAQAEFEWDNYQKVK